MTICGFAAASDAVHLTAPDRDGGGLARAISAAVDEAGGPAIDIVSAHATATPFNDAAESRALARGAGYRARAQRQSFTPSKPRLATRSARRACSNCWRRSTRSSGGSCPRRPATGRRTWSRLPSCSIARSLAHRARRSGNRPPSVGPTRLSSSAPGRAAHRPARRALGEARSCTTRWPSTPRSAVDELDACARTPVDRLVFVRADALVQLALAAVFRLEAACGPLAGAGVIVGSALATLETNALFAARIRERGTLAAEPRRFPYTSPNAVAGFSARWPLD